MPTEITKKSWFHWLVGITLILTIIGVAAFVVIPGIRSLSPTGPVVLPQQNPGCAWIPGTSSVSSIPPGCGASAQLLQITPQNFNPGTGSPIGVFKSSAAVGCRVWINGPSGWVQNGVDGNILGSSSGVCVTTLTYSPGQQVSIQFCELNTGTFSAGNNICSVSNAGFINKNTVMVCPLPALAGTGVCSGGIGAGYVPFSQTTSSSTAPTTYFTMNLIPLLGDAYDGMNSGTSESTTWVWQNSTQSTASNTNLCNVNTQSATIGCDLPKATSVGRFQANLILQPVGTFPAAPYSFGYNTFTQLDPYYQTGATARGPLQYVVTFEIKATTNNDMCLVTSSSLGAPTYLIARGGSSTDQIYVYVVPDSAVTRATDPAGNPLPGFAGSLTVNMSFDCSQVYNGSGDVVAFCATQWAYFSTKYINSYQGNQVNPEAVKTGNAGSTPTVNSSDNLGLTCSASAYTVLIKT